MRRIKLRLHSPKYSYHFYQKALLEVENSELRIIEEDKLANV